MLCTSRVCRGIHERITSGDLGFRVSLGHTRNSQQRAHRLKTSAAMGTVELTGLEMIATQAAGQHLAMATHRSRTMPACPPPQGHAQHG